MVTVQLINEHCTTGSVETDSLPCVTEALCLYCLLGMTVEAVDKGVNGCIVKTIISGAIAQDGRIQVRNLLHLEHITRRKGGIHSIK